MGLRAVLVFFLALAGARPLCAESLYLEVVVPGGAVAGPPASFNVTLNLRDADNGNQLVPPGRIPSIPPNVSLSAFLGAGPGNGALAVASVPLNAPSVTFSESYTAAESISLHASVLIATITASGASGLLPVSPGPAVKVLLLLPGETALTPGNQTGSGKTGSASNQQTNAPFSVTVKEVDQYWNVVPSVVGTARLTSTPAGFLLGATTHSFAGGLASFSVSVGTPIFAMTVQADDSINGGITAQASTMTAYGNYYFNVIVPSSATAGPPAGWPVTIELRDQGTGGLVNNSAIPSPAPTVTISIQENGSAGAGVTGVTSLPLSGNVIAFTETYTRAALITLQAQATVVTAVTGNSAPFTVNPSSYTKVLLLMPWDAARTPGGNSATGKTGAPPSYILQGALQAATVRAVDAYWNIVTNATGTAQLGTTPSGFIAGGSTQAFAGGVATFSVSVATIGYGIGITASDVIQPTVATQAESVNVFPPGLHYEFVLPSTATMTPVTFAMQAILKDGGGNPLLFSNHAVTLSAAQTTPAAGFTLGTTAGNLSAGVFSVPTQTISRTGTFKVAATDAFGFTGTSSLIPALPETHHYEITVPTGIVFGVPFGMTVTRKDNTTGLPVARNRNLVITAFLSDGSPLPAPAAIDVTSPTMTLGAQGYAQAYREPNQFVTSRSIFFLVQPALDGDGLSAYSTLSATSSVLAVSVGGPGSLALSAITALPGTGGQATLRAILRDTPEGHRMPGLTLNFALTTGTGTIAPLSAVTDSSGTAQTVLTTGLPLSSTYVVTAAYLTLSSATVVAPQVPPATILTAAGLSQTASNGVLLIKTDTNLSLTGVSQAGIQSITYSVDSGAATAYTTPFTLPLGFHTLSYYSIDIFNQTGPTSVSTLQVAAGGTAQGHLINYPNPFRAGTQETLLEYNLAKASELKLRIYNLLGQKVFEKDFNLGEPGTAAGVNQFKWDGRNGDGRVIGNGGYVAVLDVLATGEHLSRKIAVVK